MSSWELSYSGIYQDGAKLKTERDGESVCLTIRRNFDTPADTYTLTEHQSIELAYALLRAVKQNQDDRDGEAES